MLEHHARARAAKVDLAQAQWLKRIAKAIREHEVDKVFDGKIAEVVAELQYLEGRGSNGFKPPESIAKTLEVYMRAMVLAALALPALLSSCAYLSERTRAQRVENRVKREAEAAFQETRKRTTYRADSVVVPLHDDPAAALNRALQSGVAMGFQIQQLVMESGVLQLVRTEDDPDGAAQLNEFSERLRQGLSDREQAALSPEDRAVLVGRFSASRTQQLILVVGGGKATLSTRVTACSSQRGAPPNCSSQVHLILREVEHLQEMGRALLDAPVGQEPVFSFPISEI